VSEYGKSAHTIL